MKKTDTLWILLISLVLPLFAFSQAERRTKAIFVNTGSMNVAVNPTGTNRTTLYIAGSISATDSCNIVQNGITEITGDLFHGADTHLFNTNTNGNGNSTGTFQFSGLSSGSVRYLASIADNASFDRTNKYIAFPKILINTNDEILIASRMGIDAASIARNSGFKGKLVLKSETLLSGHSRKVYDASLRIVGSGSSATLVAAGSVATERDATAYIDSTGLGANTPLFGFATPFNGTQLAGYFASNWLRQTTAGTNAHITYALGENQLVNNPSQSLTPGNGYFVRLRDKTANYNALLSSGIVATVEGQDLNTTKTKYMFNGKIYDFSSLSEQVFTETSISRTISSSGTSSNNWVIGNSYTSPISIAKLGAALSASSPVTFDGKIYLLPYGSTTYQPYNYITGASDPSNPLFTEIPATSVFMLRTAANSKAGTFNITKEMLTHGASTYNTTLRTAALNSQATGNFYDYVSFIVHLATNENIYDRTAIAVYDEASMDFDSFDAEKTNSDIFSIYTLSADNVALATNKIPTEIYPINMAFVVNTVTTDFNLEVSTLGIVKGQGLWLEDKQTNSISKMEQGDTYSFTASPGDEPNRFVVYFVDTKATSEVGDEAIVPIMAVCKGKTVVIKNLQEMMDKDSRLSIIDLQGRLLIRDIVSQYPDQQIDVSKLETGTYILKITGKRHYSFKFVKNKAL